MSIRKSVAFIANGDFWAFIFSYCGSQHEVQCYSASTHALETLGSSITVWCDMFYYTSISVISIML